MPRYQPDDLLDLALAEIGRGPDLADRRDQRIGDRQIDGARKTNRFSKPRLALALGKADPFAPRHRHGAFASKGR